MNSYDSRDPDFVNSKNFHQFKRETQRYSLSEDLTSRAYKFDERPEYIGKPWTSNGIQIKIADNPDQVLPTYTNDARNCNCGVVAINAKGLHANAVFHLDPSQYRNLKEENNIRKIKTKIEASFNMLFNYLDNLILSRSLSKDDKVYVDFVISGGWSSKLEEAQRLRTIGSEKMKALIEKAFDERLAKTKKRANQQVRIYSAKSVAFGQSVNETSLHYEPQTNTTTINVKELYKRESIAPDKAYSEYKIHKLHAPRRLELQK